MTLRNKTKIFNRSLERALQFLYAFSAEKVQLSFAELSLNLGLPKSTVFRLYTTLLQYNFLKYHVSARKYALSLKLLDLGNGEH